MLSIKRTSVMVALLAALMLVVGCDSSAKSGALIGAGGGALLGQAIGGNTTGTLIGAGAGAAGGYIIGNEMDKKKAKEQDVTAPRQSSTSSSSNGAAAVTVPSNTSGSTGSNYSSTSSSGEVATVTIKNANGSTTPVTLHKQGTDWVGPKGEHYDHLPTEAELRPIYGL